MRKVMTALVIGLVSVVLMAADTNKVDPARTALLAAVTLFGANGSPEAYTALEKFVADFPNAPSDSIAQAHLYMGFCLHNQGKLENANDEYNKAVLSSDLTIAACAQEYIGMLLEDQKKQAEAQTAYMTCVRNYVWQLGAKNEQSIIWRVFNKINPKLMSTAEYKTFLEDVIRAISATETNAAFLGRLKSELEKMK